MSAYSCSRCLEDICGCTSDAIAALRAELAAAKPELLKYQTHLTKVEAKLEVSRAELAATKELHDDALRQVVLHCGNATKLAAQLAATKSELAKAIAWLDRCQWARNVIDLDAGPLEVQLAATQAREERLRNLLDGVAAAFEEVIAEADRPKGGMHVPFHGEFSAALRLPSVVARMRWWVREFRAALAERKS